MATKAEKDIWLLRVLKLDANAAGAGNGATVNPYDSLLKTVEPDYLRIIAKNPPDATKLRAVMGYAREQAAAGQHAKAIAGLERLRKMLAEAEAATTRPADAPHEGIVTYRKTLLAFRQAAVRVDGQIASLRAAIPKMMPDEDALAGNLAAALGEYTGAFLDSVDAAINMADNPGSPVTKAMIDKLDEYADEVATSALIKHVDRNPFGIQLNVQKTLGDALAAVRAAMPASR